MTTELRVFFFQDVLESLDLGLMGVVVRLRGLLCLGKLLEFPSRLGNFQFLGLLEFGSFLHLLSCKRFFFLGLQFV